MKIKIIVAFALSTIFVMAQAQTVVGNDAGTLFKYVITKQYGVPTIITPLTDLKKITIEQGQLVFHDSTGKVLDRAPLHQLEWISFYSTLTSIEQPIIDPNQPDMKEEDLDGAEVFTLAGIRVVSNFKQLPRGLYIVKHGNVARKLMKR